jgi:hypothetical protein
MNTELEDSLADALRARADAVPHAPMPPLGHEVATARPARRGRLVPVAVAMVAVVAAGVAAFVLVPGGDTTGPATTPTVTVASPGELAPGEVYYSVRLTAPGAVVGDVIIERELWQSPERAGEWRQRMAEGKTIRDGRVVPSGGGMGYPEGGVCYPGMTATEPSCTRPGSWMNATVDFMATATRDPATIGEQFHAEALAMLNEGDPPELAYLLELNYIDILLDGNGVPADLSSALRRVVAAIPGIEVTEDLANLLGERGTGYSLPGPRNSRVTLIFDADDHYLGSPTEVVRHGVAPALGEPPSRMLD